jgi:prepilin-type N-terminal cleavage/methylation domain-containing protein
MRRQAGFTIVEVISVVMIIGVLAALVLPSIKANTVRVKMSEAILAFAPCRLAVSEIYQGGGDPPADGVWGCEIDANASQYVDSVKVDEFGKITITLRAALDARVNTLDLTLQPIDNTGSPASGNGAPLRSWRCGSALDQSQVPIQFLPSTCRG